MQFRDLRISICVVTFYAPAITSHLRSADKMLPYNLEPWMTL